MKKALALLAIFLVGNIQASVLSHSRVNEVKKSAKKRQTPVIRLRFNDVPTGPVGEERRNIVKNSAAEWSRFANVNFVFTEEKADFGINIYAPEALRTLNIGTHGFVNFSEKIISLNMPVNTSLADLSHVALHELGHVLGLQHEHQHPERIFNFDIPYLISKCELEAGHCRRSVEYNNERVFEGKDYDVGLYDPQSIMHYPVARPLILEDMKFQEYCVLSAEDLKAVVRAFPGRSSEDSVDREVEKRDAELARDSIGYCRIQGSGRYFQYSRSGSPLTPFKIDTRHKAAVSASLDPRCR